ncbi:monovalent cation/H+ antiporter complex subunit F [Massilibacterium senegalense]|uniref:monovalent cation/H+ antiporter complex subunit F n=1 Tax=Massilibacterium senegalense TaxID=1632858 RepID=UPI0007805198|nr:monovalent cation/H+ antiporter complex subunit F [Massilibacterium senegalense]
MSTGLSFILYGCLIVISISMIMLLYRAIVGPTNPDRAVALDTLGVNIIAATGLLAIQLRSIELNDVILIIGILSFISTVAIAKFLEKREDHE